MVSRNQTNRVTRRGRSPCGSRLDFVRALRAIGAKMALEGDPTRTTHPRSYRVLLSCSHEDWVRMFGQESVVTDHYDPHGQLAFQAWLHCCSDGLVGCIGRQHRRPNGKTWITVRKLYFF